MPKKQKKDKKLRPKINTQIPLSQVRKVTLAEPKYRLQHAREYPILGCWVMKNWQNTGLTPVVVAREQKDGRILYGSYLIDLYCLGVKDVTVFADLSQAALQRKLLKICQGEPEPCSVELAHEIIYGAIEFAKKYEFEPHPDFTLTLADQILDPPEAHPRQGNVQFGYQGKPFYIAGPYDNSQKIDLIMRTLKRTAGEGNYLYLINLG